MRRIKKEEREMHEEREVKEEMEIHEEERKKKR